MEKRLINVLETLAGIAMIVLTLAVLIQVIARELFHIPATWTVEVSRACYTAVVFLGAPICVAEDTHLSVSMIKDMFKGKKTCMFFFHAVGDLFIYIALLTVTYGCFDRTVTEWKSTIPTVEWMTYGYIYGITLVGSLCLLYMQVKHTMNYINVQKEEE